MVPAKTEPEVEDAITKLKTLIDSGNKTGIVGSEGNLLMPGMFIKNPRLSRGGHVVGKQTLTCGKSSKF